VVYDARSDARNATMAANSRESPSRPWGFAAPRRRARIRRRSLQGRILRRQFLYALSGRIAGHHVVHRDVEWRDFVGQRARKPVTAARTLFERMRLSTGCFTAMDVTLMISHRALSCPGAARAPDSRHCRSDLVGCSLTGRLTVSRPADRNSLHAMSQRRP